MNDFLPHYQNLSKAIAAEQNNELTFFKNLNESKTLRQKIILGFIWYPVEVVKIQDGLSNQIEIEIKKIRQLYITHAFKEGAAVTFFNVQEARTEIKANITALRRDKMRIAIHVSDADKLDHFSKGNVGVELVYDDRPYRLMQQALQSLMSTNYPPHVYLRQALALQQIPATDSKAVKIADDFLAWRQDLNQSQKEAIQTVMQAPHIGIIHGPPGTGKTTTLVALAAELLKEEKQILVCAASNQAVDLLAERMANKGMRVLRVGNISRIDEDTQHLTIEAKMREHADWQQIKKVKILAQEADRQANAYKRNFGQEEKAERKTFRHEARELKIWASQLEDKLFEEILEHTQIIATTLIGASHHLLKNNRFKTVIIDEASQSSEPECWNAILKADRVILAGDHLQLPPTIKSSEAKDLGLEETILDRMVKHIPHVALLSIQYRMNDAILGFSNQQFYEKKLASDASNASRFLANDNQALTFIDTAGCGFEEQSNPENKSLSNEGEYDIIRRHIQAHLANYVGISIGVISPYAEQVRLIRQLISEDEALKQLDIEVNSIDGFQGQEKEVIYISLVRSNERSEIGFLKDFRRLNVAMTRAQKKLVIVGDSATIAQFPLYRDLVAHVEANGLYDSAWSYLTD